MYIDYGDIISLRNHSSIDDFKEAIHSYYTEYVEAYSKQKGKQDIYFFLVIMPDHIR